MSELGMLVTYLCVFRSLMRRRLILLSILYDEAQESVLEREEPRSMVNTLRRGARERVGTGGTTFNSQYFTTGRKRAQCSGKTT
jgi:hypothetical protein